MRASSRLPNPDEAFEGAPLALANARAHVAAAEVLHDHAHNGLAVAHLVLGAEEAIKAACLAIHSLGGIYDEKLLKMLLRRHSARHGSAGLFLTAVWAQQKFEQGLRPELNPESTEILSWWFGADKLKMRGFYADFEKSGWLTPNSIEPGDYLRSRVHTSGIIEIVDGIVARIGRLDPEQRKHEGEEHRKIAREIEELRQSERPESK